MGVAPNALISVLHALLTVKIAQIQNVMIAHQATIYQMEYAQNALKAVVLALLIAISAMILHAIHVILDITSTLELAVNVQSHAEAASQIVILAQTQIVQHVALAII